VTSDGNIAANLIDFVNDLDTNNVVLTAEGDILANQISAGSLGKVYITSNGSVSVTIEADELTAQAVNGLIMDTSVTSVSANLTGSGDLTISETDGIILIDVTTAAGNISITAGGDVQVGSVNAADHVVTVTSTDAIG
jgi:hypothetical protein